MTIDPSDPFGERIELRSRANVNALGADIAIESTDAALTNLALEAYGNLPRLAGGERQSNLKISMIVNDYARSWNHGALPPAPRLSSGTGFLCATIDAGNFAVVDPANNRAFVSVSRAMLKHAHLLRYELIEFAILTLAARQQSLVPLHAACMGIGDAGCLLIGQSGSGKSSLCLLGLQNGMFVLSEDSTFVAPQAMQVFGVPNFLHLRSDLPALLAYGTLHDQIARSAIIVRRSGARKFALDLRAVDNPVPSTSMRLAATVLVTTQTADSRSALQPCDPAVMVARMQEEQPYAAGLPEWSEFSVRITTTPAFELRRTNPPFAAVDALRDMLGSGHEIT